MTACTKYLIYYTFGFYLKKLNYSIDGFLDQLARFFNPVILATLKQKFCFLKQEKTLKNEHIRLEILNSLFEISKSIQLYSVKFHYALWIFVVSI